MRSMFFIAGGMNDAWATTLFTVCIISGNCWIIPGTIVNSIMIIGISNEKTTIIEASGSVSRF